MKTREAFLENLRMGSLVVSQVASFLAKNGHFVRVVPTVETPDAKSRMEYADEGDIEITQRIEVKFRPGLEFSSVETYPYPDVIVDETYKADRKQRCNLSAYIVVNKDRTGYLYIPARTKKHWFIQDDMDKTEGEMKENYHVGLEYATYYSMGK